MIKKYALSMFTLGLLSAVSTAAPVQFLSPFTSTPAAGKTNQSVSSMPDGLTSDPDSLWQRETLTGDWGGLRDRLNDAGFAVTGFYAAEAFGSTGGARSGAISDGLLDVAFDFDLERITHFWPDAVFHFNLLYIYGSSLSNTTSATSATRATSRATILPASRKSGCSRASGTNAPPSAPACSPSTRSSSAPPPRACS